ncbi:MAG: hypothetical protein ACI9UK_002163 [Candidatus Krumholzibacteriia bacterium]|jgi:hypothetical protein
MEAKMLRCRMGYFIGGLVMTLVVMALVPSSSAWAQVETSRASWLLDRGQSSDFALAGQLFEQGEIGGGNDQPLELENENIGSGGSGAWPILMSLVLPGAGEAYLGYKRGYAMAAVDILAWTQVSKFHKEGGDIRDEYIAFADAHYSDELLVHAYFTGGHPQDGQQLRTEQGLRYFDGVEPMVDTGDLGNLPLYVSKDDDFREYYENLGKWDQFIFGWDDYTRPDLDTEWSGTYDRAVDLQYPWVSRNREAYRVMRGESNDAYKSRDRWLYVNIGLRLFSVMQVAYLQGLLGGGPDANLEVAGHTVGFSAVPMGVRSGAVSASVSF